MGFRLLTRSIRPPDSLDPNDNDPSQVPPATVGPPQAAAGDPHGVELQFGGEPGAPAPPVMRPAAWSGWPSEWFTPGWSQQHLSTLADTAWACLDLNARTLSTMPPYLVGAADSIGADWLRNPQPDTYASWSEFAKSLFRDYQLGEAFVVATARYSTGYPARFHCLPPWTVEVDMDQGFRRYRVGGRELPPGDICHLRYQSSVDDAHGHGPLEAGRARLVAAEVLTKYGTNLAAGGGIPPSVLQHENIIGPTKAAELKAQWVNARLSSIGEPAVLEGGITWQPTQVNPRDMALIELLQFNESRISILLGVPPFLVGLPSGGDSMTYKNVSSMLDFHWRAGLRPSAVAVMQGLSEWLLPRGTTVEVNQDSYVQPEPLERAQTAQILNSMVDAQGNPAITVAEIREVERLDNTTADELVSSPLA